MASSTSIKFTRSIQVSPETIYHSFTNATALRGWFCDMATVLATPSGRIYLWWNNGFYTCGEFTRLESPRLIHFTWHGRKEPDITQVKILITPEEQGSLLSVEHTGLQPVEKWKEVRNYLEQLWEQGLENLVSTLEKGPDLRIVNRPMLGIFIGAALNEEKIRELGIPVSYGVRIEGVMDGMGSQKAGLKKDDVIIEVDGSTVSDFFSLRTTLEGRQAGESINVVYYRGEERKTTDMELGRRVLPEVPKTPSELANLLKETYTNLQADLEKVFENVDENEAAYRPAEDEWNAKETLAHLIHTERDLQSHINDLIFSQERISDGYAENAPGRIRATVNAYLTYRQLIKAFRSSMNETIDFLNYLPDDFQNRKGLIWRLSYELLQFTDHIREHIEQIQNCITSARQEKKARV